MKNSKYAILTVMIFALGALGALSACGGSKGEVAKPTPAAAPAAADEAQADAEKHTTDGAGVTPDADAKPPTSETSAVSDQDLEDGYAFLMAMAKAAGDNKGDCANMGAALNTLFDASADVMKRMSRVKDDEATQKKWDEQYKVKAEEKMATMMRELGKCMEHPAVIGAMKRLQ